MCGRFALDTTPQKIKSQFSIDELPVFTPRYNIAPSQEVLVLMQTEEGLHGEFFSWGLVPFFAKDKVISPPLINARAETVAEKPAFRQAFKGRRGLVIMSGFFEWLRNEEIKQPYYISKKTDELLAVAALWDCWQSKEGEVHYSCCMLTAQSNELMTPLHHRMPVLLTPEEQVLWLNNKEFNAEELLAVLHPYRGDDLQIYPVTPRMNNWRFLAPEAIGPLAKLLP